jgi:hypothetical protein
MINIQTFMTIGSGVHVYLSILRGCSLGTSDGRDLKECRSDDLRCHDTHIKFHDDRLRHASNIMGITSTIREGAVLVLLMGGMYEICR